jgi:nitroreductase
VVEKAHRSAPFNHQNGGSGAAGRSLRAVPSEDPAELSFYDVVTTTRAIRRYLPDPIPEDDLAAIMFAASRAPSGSNRQQFRFLVLRDGPKATKARELLGRSFQSVWAAKRASDGYDEGTGADPNSPKARMAATMQHYVDHVGESPVVILACYRRWRDAHPSEGASIYPACQNLLLTARSLGYGGVLTMWHQLIEGELKAILDIPDDVVIGTVITLGKPVGHHGPVRRRPLEELVYEDGWNEPAPWAIDPPGTRHTGAGPPQDRR